MLCLQPPGGDTLPRSLVFLSDPVKNQGGQFFGGRDHPAREDGVYHMFGSKSFEGSKHTDKIKVCPGGLPAEDLDVADKAAGLFLFRMFKNLLRSPFLINDSLIHVEDPGRDLPGKFHLMGDDQHGHPLPGQVADDRQDFTDHGRVQGGCGFVKEQDFRLHGDRPHNCGALLLASGKFRRIAESLVAQSHRGQQSHCVVIRFLPAFFQQPDRSHHEVFHDGQMGKEKKGLKDHADFAAQHHIIIVFCCRVLSLKPDSASCRHLQAVDQIQESTLAGPRRTNNTDNVSFPDLAVHILQRHHTAGIGFL